jgi:hypothetical protein
MTSSAQALLETFKARYKFLRADLGPGDRVVATAMTGGAAFNIDRVEADGDLIISFGFDSNSREVVLVQHYSEMSIVFTVVPKTETEERPEFQIGFLASPRAG